MKLCGILLIVSVIAANANGFSQSTVTWSAKSATLQSAFKAIEQQTAFTIFCDDAIFRDSKTVTLSVKKQSVDEFMKAVLKDQPGPLEYVIRDKVIVVRKVQPTSSKLSAGEPLVVNNASIDVRGVVKDETGKPAEGVSVRVKGKEKGTVTNSSGEFFLPGVDENAILVFSSVNLQTFEIKVSNRTELTVTLKAKISELGDVAVTTVNTGYQQLPKERSTGSFSFVDSQILNRRITTNIIDRLEGVTSSVQFTKNKGVPGLNQSDISVRGRSTIFSNPNPIIILDNFPYDGDLSTINPNDIENVTILKDAAAASIWGARSGNGVIVITSKRGRANHQNVSFSSNFTIGSKPDLYYQPIINSTDAVDLELFLNSKGYFNSVQAATSKSAISPIVEILAMRKAGTITATDSASRIDSYRQYDLRRDLDKYIYQKAFNQQYAVSLSGGSTNDQYYLSLGYDNNKPNLTYNSYERYTFNLSNVYSLLKDKLELTANIRYTLSSSYNNNPGTFVGDNVVYNRLADDNGMPLPVVNNYRLNYIDTAGKGLLLNWKPYPLADIRNTSNKTTLDDYHIKGGLKYKVIPGLELNGLYEFARGKSDNANYQPMDVYSTRDAINSFSQVNFSTNTVARAIPLGSILKSAIADYKTSQIRLQINYNKSWNGGHQVNMIGGFETRSYITGNSSQWHYGYDDNTKTYVANIDFANLQPLFTGGSSRINSNVNQNVVTNNFVSQFLNVGYSMQSKYIVTASVRKDEANLLGNDINNKGVPLWSVGLGWEITKEKFFKIDFINKLKLRSSYGYNGNLDLRSSSQLAISPTTTNQFGIVSSGIVNNPNSQLRWEKTGIFNIGIDFAVDKDILSGSIEYFRKKGTDLLGNGLIAPQTGLSTFYGNVADMKANGLDISLNSRISFNKDLLWTANFQLSYTKEIVTDYKIKAANIYSYISSPGSAASQTISPLEGYPIYSIFSFKFGGLDALGNPNVYLDGSKSQNYSALINSTDFSNLVFSGSAVPTTFGNFLNTFTFKNLSLSFNLVYKLGYYFRRPSLQYSTIFSKTGVKAHADYYLRWQKPGDELITNVPSLVYPFNSSREVGYIATDVLVEKGDHVRLQDINLTYTFPRNSILKKVISNIRVYTVLSNIGILWRANKFGIDPDYISTIPNPFNLSFGLKCDF